LILCRTELMYFLKNKENNKKYKKKGIIMILCYDAQKK
jgi:hypothetical protein